MSLVDLHGLSNKLWLWASKSPNLSMPQFTHLQKGSNKSTFSLVVVRIRWAYQHEVFRLPLPGSSRHDVTGSLNYCKPFADRRHALLSFSDSIKSSAVLMWPLSNEWIKCVLLLLPLNVQTDTLGSNFLRKASPGLIMFWGLAPPPTGPSSLGCVFEITVGYSLFKATMQSVNLTLQQLYFSGWKRCKPWGTDNWKAKKTFLILSTWTFNHGRRRREESFPLPFLCYSLLTISVFFPHLQLLGLLASLLSLPHVIRLRGCGSIFSSIFLSQCLPPVLVSCISREAVS